MNSIAFRASIRSVAAVAALAALSVPGLAEIPLAPQVAETGKMIVANTLEYAPFEFRDESGKLVGINVELAEAAAQALGVELELQRTPFASMIPALAAGRFDISWETYVATEERLAQVDFVMYIQAGIVASTTPEKTAMFEGDSPLCGKRLGLASGAASDFVVDRLNAECVEKGLPPIEKQFYPQSVDIVQAVLADRVDARFDDATASGYFEVTSGGQLVVLPGVYDEVPMGMAIRKGDDALAEMLRAAVAELIANGSYQQIMERYGMTSAMIDQPWIVRTAADIQR